MVEVEVEREVKLIPEILELKNLEEICKQIETFLRNKMNELHRNGFILGLSGGLDSAVVAYLCARSVEPEKVLALYMPEKDSNPKHAKDVERVVNTLGIRLKVIDLTPILEVQGIYGLQPMKYLRLLATRKLKGFIVRKGIEVIERVTGRDLIAESRLSSSNKLIAGGNAYVHFKHRLRMVVLYLYAELENLLVVGAANRTEYLTGVFTKFGIDGVADAMPLLPFYKTQVRKIAKYLGVPKEILQKPPDPDVFPGFDDKEKLFGDEKNKKNLDLILFGLERGLSPLQIAKALGIELKEVTRIQTLVENSRHMRESPYIPNLHILRQGD